MEFSNNFITIFFPGWSLVLAGFLLSLGITWRAIPSIVLVAMFKGLYGKPDDHSYPTDSTPLLGGVAVFAGLILSTVVIAGVGFVHELKYIIAGMIILFFVGVKDDILMIDPKKKLIAQLMSSILIIVLGDIRIGNFHGVAGINEIPYVVSILFTLLVFLLIINGFNLIDGIDGLASGVGIVTSLTFGGWFWLAGYIPYVVLCFSLAGSLIAFFRFNVFSEVNRIYLGDSGSLIIGLTLAIVCVRFLQFELSATGKAIVQATPAVAIGILIVPIFDALRVIIIRIVNGRSPFRGDRNHIHHRLLDLGYNHLKATIIILSVNILFIVLVLLLRDVGHFTLLMIILVLAIFLSNIPVYLIGRKNKMARD